MSHNNLTTLHGELSSLPSLRVSAGRLTGTPWHPPGGRAAMGPLGGRGWGSFSACLHPCQSHGP